MYDLYSVYGSFIMCSVSSVVLPVSSLRFGVSILLLVLIEFGRCFVSMVSSLVCVSVDILWVVCVS